MRSDTRSISIRTAARRTFAFLADPANLPRWAVGFAHTVVPDGDAWIVTTPHGTEMTVRIEAHEPSGCIDFRMQPAPDVSVVAYSRVLQRGDESEYVFTQYQHPGMTDEVFHQSIETLRHELVVLKSILEVECPL